MKLAIFLSFNLNNFDVTDVELLNEKIYQQSIYKRDTIKNKRH